jgi:hypothetical protein
MTEHTPDKTTYQGFREYWDAAPDSIAKQNTLMILRAWEADRKGLELENLGLLDAAVKSAERIEALGRDQEELARYRAGASKLQDHIEALEHERETLHAQIDGETKALLGRIGPLERTVEAYKEAYLSERAYHANNSGENAARRKKAVAALREAHDG